MCANKIAANIIRFALLDLAMGSELINLIHAIKLERNFETISLLHIESDACLSDSEIKMLTMPIIITNEFMNLSSLAVNNELLVLNCLNFLQDPTESLNITLQGLGNWRFVRIIFYWRAAGLDDLNAQPQQSEKLLKLFKFCRENYLPNVISIFENFTINNLFYSYTQFPIFAVEQMQFDVYEYFPNRLRNLHGAALRTALDEIQPYSTIYYDRAGKPQFTGFVVRAVQAFARKHNATLIYTSNYGQDPKAIIAMTRNATLDIPTCIVNSIVAQNFLFITNIFELESIRIIIPFAKPLAIRDVFPRVLHRRFYLFSLLLVCVFAVLLTLERHHLECCFKQHGRICTIWTFPIACLHMLLMTLPALLGYAIYARNLNFLTKKIICLLLLMIGIYVNTTSVAYLQSYFTRTPDQQEIRTFEQLLASSIRVLVTAHHYDSLKSYAGTEFFDKYKNCFEIASSFEFFHEARNSLNTRYAYVSSRAHIEILMRQQAFLSRPLFHTSENMYTSKHANLFIPLHEHSIYRAMLNTFILQLQESGLIDHWRSKSYDYMLEAGKIVKQHYVIEETTVDKLKLTDFYWLWWLYLVGFSLSTTLFLMEYFLACFC